MIKRTTYGYTIENKNYFLDIVFYAENIVRFVYSKEEKVPTPTAAVVAEAKQVDLELDGNMIQSNTLKIVVNEQTLKVAIYDLNGNLLSQDRELNIEQVEINKEMLWEKGIYGMGEKYGWMNRKGTDTVNWCSDVLAHEPLHHPMIKAYHTAIPFYIGLDQDKAYGIYYDNSFRTYFDFSRYKEGSYFKADGGKLDYYFIYGEQVSDVVKGYSHLTGTMPLPRKDFLGYHQCRWSYENRDELMAIATKMREEDIPCDILYLDIDYMKDYKVFTVDSKKFNDFKQMNEKLKTMGFKLVVIIDPGVKKEAGYDVYETGIEKDYFITDTYGEVYVGEVWPGDSVFPDFLREEIRNWWGALHKDLIEKGVEGIWNDMNEPANFITDEKTLPESTRHRSDEGEKKDHAEIHNLYAFYQAMGTYEGLKKLQHNKRPFVLTRAAFAGTQRYAALWTGDNSSVWEHLEGSIPMFMNLGLSGYSFVGGDVGGFAGDSHGELLSRWTQLGAFTPFFRNHSAKGTIHQEPWSFGKETLDNTRKYIHLRYQFMTYLYNLMAESSQGGHPVMRPLFYHHQGDEKTYNIQDQFLFGESVMVCPILRPGQTARRVYLPKGQWYDFWTMEKHEGGQNIIKEADLQTLPLFIKAGAIIPMDASMNYIGEKENQLDIHIYSGNHGSYKLYLDDGLSFDYEKGVYSEIVFKVEETENSINITAGIQKNGYKLPKMMGHVHGLKETKTIIFNGQSMGQKTFSMDL